MGERRQQLAGTLRPLLAFLGNPGNLRMP